MPLPSQVFEKEILGWAEKAINEETPFEAMCEAVNIVSGSMAFAFAGWLARKFTTIVDGDLVLYEDVNNIVMDHFQGCYIASELWIHFLKLLKAD